MASQKRLKRVDASSLATGYGAIRKLAGCCICSGQAAHESVRYRAWALGPLLSQVGDHMPKRSDRERYPSGDPFIVGGECPGEVECHQGGAARVECDLDAFGRPQLVRADRRRWPRIFDRISHVRPPTPRTKFEPSPGPLRDHGSQDHGAIPRLGRQWLGLTVRAIVAGRPDRGPPSINSGALVLSSPRMSPITSHPIRNGRYPQWYRGRDIADGGVNIRPEAAA